MTLLVAVFSACSNHENIPQEQDNKGDIPMIVTTNMNESTISRAGITNDNLTEHTFLFSSKPKGEDESSSYIYTNLTATYNSEDSKWGFSDGNTSIVPVWKDQTTNVIVTALRAATPADDVYSLEVNPDQSKDIQANDWLYFSGTINPTLSVDDDTNYELALKDGAIPINFNHINSKIDINLSFKEGLSELTINSVVIGGTKISATLEDGVPTVTTDDESESVSACSVNESTHNYEVILLPQTATLSVEVEAKDNGNQTHVFYWTSTSVTLESGKKYTLKLTLDYNEVSGLLASRGAWTGGETQQIDAK